MASSTKQSPCAPRFVVIEGLDGAGTTTQSARVVDALQRMGRPAVLTREPSDGPIGALIRQMLAMRVVAPGKSANGLPGFKPVSRQALALLFAADRIDHLDAEIIPALDRGSIVVSDRYYHSSLAYQADPAGADAPPDQPLDLDWVSALNSRARAPDLTIFLDASVDLCLDRLSGRSRRDIFETREQLSELARGYAQVLEYLHASGEQIIRLDASLERAELTAQIIQAIDELTDS